MIVRDAEKKDASKIIDLFEQLDKDTTYMLFEPGERNLTVFDEEKIIESISKNSKQHFLIGEIENDILGFCGLTIYNHQRNSHIGEIVLGVKKSAWAKGMGTALIEFSINRAINNDVKKIELKVRTDNKPAINLYKKFGFEIEGERKNSLFIDGKFYNEYFMGKELLKE